MSKADQRIKRSFWLYFTKKNFKSKLTHAQSYLDTSGFKIKYTSLSYPPIRVIARH